MLIDTHCHLDAEAFAGDRAAVIARARDAGVALIVVPAVDCHGFEAIQVLARATPGVAYALGIHPMRAARVTPDDLQVLARALDAARDDPRLVAVGEIGLDFFLPEVNTPLLRERQEWLYMQQLDLAQRFGLPVLLHVRRAQDRVLKHLRGRTSIGGVAHAFNGSVQQARQFVALGFTLGIGGAMTFERARRIRRVAAELPPTSFVLETDAPDIPPAWLMPAGGGGRARNEPAQVAGIARVFARLRQVDEPVLVAQCAENAFRVLPRLKSFAYACGSS